MKNERVEATLRRLRVALQGIAEAAQRSCSARCAHRGADDRCAYAGACANRDPRSRRCLDDSFVARS